MMIRSFSLLPSAFLIAVAILSCSPPPFDPVAEEKAIRELLSRQEIDWNEGHIEGFMTGYWKSDSLMFVGSKITQGWDSTLARYRRSYPSTEAMGHLTFTFYEFRFISNDACLVTGRYLLKRESDNPTGLFTLLLRKMNDQWVIVYDHTS